MMHQIEIKSLLATAALLALVAAASSVKAQDYDGEAETAITGLSGLGGLSGLSGLSGLTALANGVVTGYAPMSASSESGASDSYPRGGDRYSSQDSSDADSGDYEEDSNDSSASEEHPILSKFINLISGGRHKRSIEPEQEAAESAQPAKSGAHSRVKRGYKGWVPYVSTYVKTDKKAHFKWGVKAKVGKKYGK